MEDNDVITDEEIEDLDCGGDWTRIGSSCYQTVSLRNTVSRHQAQVICQERGGKCSGLDNFKITFYFLLLILNISSIMR